MSLSLSSVLKSLMVRAGFSEHELSRKTGIKQPIIHRLLSGENLNPKLDTLKPIAQYFAISISQLIGEEPLFEKNGENSAQNLSDWIPIPLLDKNVESYTCPKKNAVRWIMMDCSVSEKAFAIQLHESTFSFPLLENSIIVVDPLKSPSHQDFVLIKNKQDWLLKYYLKKENKGFIFSSTTEPDTVEMLLSETNIIGTIVRVIYTRE